MGFVMEGLEAEAYDRVYPDGLLVRRVLAYFRPVARMMALVAIAAVLASVLDAVLPVLIARGVDQVSSSLHGGRSFSPADAYKTVGVILVTGTLSWCCNFARQWYTARAVSNVTLRLREDAFAAVMARDMSFYDEFPSGKIVSRVTSDTEDFSAVVTLTLSLLSQSLLLIIIVVLLFAINVTLALLAMIIAPVVVVVALSFRHIARRVIQQTQRAGANINALVQESISGISVAKNFGQEQRIYGEFAGINQQTYRVNLKAGFIFSGLFPLLNVIGGIGTVIVVYFGGLRSLHGTISPGSWYFFVQSIPIFWGPLTSIASFWSQFQQGLASSERVFALIDAEPRVVQRDRQMVERLRGDITFRDVTFRYTEQQAVLEHFSLHIPAGQTVAIVGHTGAGKSTIAKLIARFYEFQAGELLVDGRDIRTFDLAAYHRQLGIVPQIPFLFSGSIAANIRYGTPEATDDAVQRAAHAIGGGDWLDTLPAGLATDVGEEGKALSLGQRQLVALARVVLQDPAILIMDEATASVDPLTETLIQEGLEKVLRSRTAIVIAHRLSTVQHADRILVMREGRIVEEGNHAELLQRGGYYALLYNTYFRQQRIDYEPFGGFVPVRFTDKEIALTDLGHEST